MDISSKRLFRCSDGFAMVEVSLVTRLNSNFTFSYIRLVLIFYFEFYKSMIPKKVAAVQRSRILSGRLVFSLP